MGTWGCSCVFQHEEWLKKQEDACAVLPVCRSLPALGCHLLFPCLHWVSDLRHLLLPQGTDQKKGKSPLSALIERDVKDPEFSVEAGVGVCCVLCCFLIPKENLKAAEEILLILFYHCWARRICGFPIRFLHGHLFPKLVTPAGIGAAMLYVTAKPLHCSWQTAGFCSPFFGFPLILKADGRNSGNNLG